MLIVNDQTIARTLAASALALTFLLAGATGVRASDAAPPAANVDASARYDTVSVSLAHDGEETRVETAAATVGALLAERGVRLAAGDDVVPDPAAPLQDGTHVVLRRAVPVRLEIDQSERRVDSAARTVGDLLAEQHVILRPNDEVIPAATAALAADARVRVVRVDTWTARSHAKIAPALRARVDTKMLRGQSRTLDRGAPGEREVTVRFIKRDDGLPTRVVLASRIVRPARAKVVVRGIATYESLARIAHLGFASALQFASSALHMLATAYSAGCYGCSGVTASGARAGYGIIAVDPAIIPLGTRLFIPGYGRAVAGDTGGAIVGSRVDLGFDSNGEALRWGRRPVTVYILK